MTIASDGSISFWLHWLSLSKLSHDNTQVAWSGMEVGSVGRRACAIKQRAALLDLIAASKDGAGYLNEKLWSATRLMHSSSWARREL